MSVFRDVYDQAPELLFVFEKSTGPYTIKLQYPTREKIALQDVSCSLDQIFHFISQVKERASGFFKADEHLFRLKKVTIEVESDRCILTADRVEMKLGGLED